MKEEQTPQDTASDFAQALNSVQNYYDSGKNEEIRNMRDEDMYRILTNLEQSEYWVAILKYINKRTLFAQNAICTIDPHNAPGAISKYQGAMIGLADLPTAVIQLVEKRKKTA